MASSESFQLPTLKQLIAHSNIQGENERTTQLPLPPLPLISPRQFLKDEDEVIDIPIQILDDKIHSPNILLRVPQKNLNKTILHTVLKIRVIDPKALGNSELERETNLVMNDLLLKEVKALREREVLESGKQKIKEGKINLENEKLMELERSAATYRGRRLRVDPNFSKSSTVDQDSVSSMTVVHNSEESLPTNPSIERGRRRRIQPDHARRNDGIHGSRTRPSRIRSDRIVDSTKPDTTTISITTSRGSTLPDLATTDYPRGFLLTRSTDETIIQESKMFVHATESSNSFHSIDSSADQVSFNHENVTSDVETISSVDGELPSENGKEFSEFEKYSDDEMSSDDEIPPDNEKLSLDNSRVSSEFGEASSDETTPSNDEIESEDGKSYSDNEKETVGFGLTSDDATETSNVKKVSSNNETSLNIETSSIFETSPNVETIFPNVETISSNVERTSSNVETVFPNSQKNEEIHPNVELVFPNVETISSNVETVFPNAGNEEIFPSTEEEFLNTDKEFSVFEKMIPTFNSDDETTTGNNSNVTYFNQDSLPDDKDENSEFNFFANTEATDADRDYFDYNKHHQDEMNFFVTNSKIPQRNEDLATTITHESESRGTTIKDINSTPATAIGRVTSPRRLLRKKIRKLKPAPKESSTDLNSPKRIRSKKVTEKISVKTSVSGNSDSSENPEFLGNTESLGYSHHPGNIDFKANTDFVGNSDPWGDSEYSIDLDSSGNIELLENPKFVSRNLDPSANSESSEKPELISTNSYDFSTNKYSIVTKSDSLASNSSDYETYKTVTNSEVSAFDSGTTFPSTIVSTLSISDSTPTTIVDSTINYFDFESSTEESFTNKVTKSQIKMDYKNVELESITKSPEFSTETPNSKIDKVESEKRILALDTKILRRNQVTRNYETTENIQNQYLNVETTLAVPIRDQNKTPTIVSSRKSEFVLTDSLIDNQQVKEFSNTEKMFTDKMISLIEDPKPALSGRRRVLKRKRIDPKNEDKHLKIKTEPKTTSRRSESKSKVETIETSLTNSGNKSKPEIIETSLNKSEAINNFANSPVNRKRVVVYRGAKRFSTVTTPSTTTVQSFSVTGNHQNQIPSRRRMRTIVRKRPKTHDTSKDLEESNRKGKNLSLSPEMKIVEDAEEAGSEVNTYRTSSDNSRRAGSFYREPNRSRVRTTTHPPFSSVHPSLRRFTSPARQTLHIQETTLPSQLNFASADDAAALLEHLARLEDQKAEMDDQANRAHELVLENFETTTESGDSPIGTTFWRKISTTELPRSLATTGIPALRRRQGQKYFNKIVTQNLTQRPRRPAIIDYDYYEDEEIRFVGKPRLNGKLYVTSRGHINCLDQGNFPHPTSCKKFITCARMVNGLVVGTEYTCPHKLSFDPIGGICNWSAGLGCKE